MPTRIVAVRHGKVEETTLFSKEQKLSKEGKNDITSLASLLKNEGYIPPILYTSPKYRAIQTAEILANILGGNIFAENALSDPFDKNKILEILESTKEKAEVIFLIGHAPTLAEFIEELVGENILPTGLPKGGAAVVVFEDIIMWGEGKLEKTFP